MLLGMVFFLDFVDDRFFTYEGRLEVLGLVVPVQCDVQRGAFARHFVVGLVQEVRLVNQVDLLGGHQHFIGHHRRLIIASSNRLLGLQARLRHLVEAWLRLAPL